MNPFARTEDHELLEENLRRLLVDSNEFASRRERLASPNPNRLALWPAFADQGVIAAAFDEVHGGFAGDARTVALIMAQLGSSLAVEPFLATAIMAARVLLHWTDEAERRSVIDSIIAGEHICIIAHNSYDDPFADPLVQASSGSQSIVLSGFIPAVRHAELAHAFLVPATSADGSMAFFRIEGGLEGVTRESYRLIDGAGAADIRFDGVRAAPSSRLGLDTPARAALDEAIEWGLLGLAAEAAGIIGSLNEATFAYLMERKQFGAPIGSFQALQHRGADMWIAAEESAAIVDLAIDSMNAASSGARAIILSAMKVVADKAGRHVGNEAVQLHGGMGVSDELIISHYFRRLAAIRNELGSADAHRLRFRNTP